MGQDSIQQLSKNRCTSVLDRSKMFDYARVIYIGEPRCIREVNHNGLHDGGWSIGQWADSWSEGYNE